MTGNILISWTLMHAIFAISILPHMVGTNSFRKLHYLFIYLFLYIEQVERYQLKILFDEWDLVRNGMKLSRQRHHSYSYSHTHETLWIFISAMMKNSKLSENVQNMSAQRHLSKCNGKATSSCLAFECQDVLHLAWCFVYVYCELDGG